MNEIVRYDKAELEDIGNLMISSGLFKDVHKVAEAAVKVLAGKELGLNPVESMRSFHIIEGKVEVSADLLARLVKQSEKYDYSVAMLTETVCELTFWQDGEEIGTSSFSDADRARAGLKGKAWDNYPRNMLFARAMSNGVGWFCPDVVAGRTYVDGEIDPLNEQPPNVDIPPEAWIHEPIATVIDVGGSTVDTVKDDGLSSEPGSHTDGQVSLVEAPPATSEETISSSDATSEVEREAEAAAPSEVATTSEGGGVPLGGAVAPPPPDDPYEQPADVAQWDKAQSLGLKLSDVIKTVNASGIGDKVTKRSQVTRAQMIHVIASFGVKA